MIVGSAASLRAGGLGSRVSENRHRCNERFHGATKRRKTSSRCRRKRHRGDPGRNVQSPVGLDAERLQRNRVVTATDQRIRPNPDPDRGARRRAPIGAREVAGPQLRRRRDHGPDQDTAFRVADIDAELRNLSAVTLDPAGSCEGQGSRMRYL